jgi:L-alanine-DL-glutamate epimerase-like enolase superfamily enzyme
MSARTLSVRHESWPIRGAFTISRGSKTSAEVVVVEIADASAVGRGECVPYPRYGESPESAVRQIAAIQGAIEDGLSRIELQDRLPAGAARNAVDAALWDLEAKRTGTPVWRLAGLPEPARLTTAYTLSLDTPARMAAAAAAGARPLLKLKLGGGDDVARVRAVRKSAPDSRLIVDVNEAWTAENFAAAAAAMAALGVALIEQPLAADDDGALAGLAHPVPLCADESCHGDGDLERLGGRYEFVNIKLDKTGGLTAALALAHEAKARGFGIMLGCMLGTSLGMAPASLLAAAVEYVDLDGPLLLDADRTPGIHYEGSVMHPPPSALWG